jgi:HEPN domain-containing protein
MIKARSDLATADLLINGQEKHFDTGSYHCQQAAEKALKGWLTAKEIVFPKTHVLEELLELCIPSATAFAQFRRHCEELTPLGHEFRYPGDVIEPNNQQARERSPWRKKFALLSKARWNSYTEEECPNG